MKKWLGLALLCCSTVQADMLDALKAYEQKNYAEAQQQFAELLPLGNELAAFNLGVMAYQGEGQARDLTSALAYFKLAAALKHPQAEQLLTQIQAELNAEQLSQVETQFARLQRAVTIQPISLEKLPEKVLPEPVKRVAPDYPMEAARKGLFGYVTLRFLVDEAGQVTAIDSLDAYPDKVFNKSAMRAVKRWQYEATGAKHMLKVRLDYSLGNGITEVSEIEKLEQKHQLWQFASAGAPQYQFVLGTLLSLLEIQSHNGFWFDPDLPLSAQPDFSIYKNRAHLKADLDGFWGYAVVRVDQQGVITEQLRTEFDSKSTLSSLIGHKLEGKVESDVYRLYRHADQRSRRVAVVPSVTAPASMSAMFWWEQAAKNGNLEAQRVMAAHNTQWENYLLSQQDGEVMAWAGTRLILDGQREQGMQLLEQAIAKNYAPAKEMKQQFM
ncbi:TonB family protein [Rheinheimera fenheensis]|uniref:TonB family protein n=1 Tax=Rheinheimera fenheensis TaxID=3152295 RepID=UPI00325CB501